MSHIRGDEYMQTTQLYVELVLIGMESLFGFCILMSDILGKEIIYQWISKIESLGGTIVSIGACYIVGLVFDRFADIVFQKKEKEKKVDWLLKV